MQRWRELSSLLDTRALCGAQTYRGKVNRYFYIKHTKSYFLFASGRHSAGDRMSGQEKRVRTVPPLCAQLSNRADDGAGPAWPTLLNNWGC